MRTKVGKHSPPKIEAKSALYFTTKHGRYYRGMAEEILESRVGRSLVGKVNLILTSPPFPLNKKKSYGNHEGDDYKKWLVDFAPVFSKLLARDGSIVLEIGNSWLPGRPVQSLLHLESLLAFVKNKEAGLRLCQQFICYNPARLPSPAQWVTIERIRSIDSFTHVWWLAKRDRPQADNRRILRPYSKSMRSLLERGSFNAGLRPSEHRVSKTGFLSKHSGSIHPNVIDLEASNDGKEMRLPKNVLRFANTNSNDEFLVACRQNDIKPHPARMPMGLAAFFIEYLTKPGDLVLDPFSGSNTTGYCAEKLGREWVSIEALESFAVQAKLRSNIHEKPTNRRGHRK